MAGDEEINYPVPHMREVARKARKTWESDAGEGVDKINQPDATAALFGSLPELAKYGTVFEQAKSVYVAAMKGAKTDLTNVLDGIDTSANRTSDKDDEAEAALVALWNRWNTQPQQSQTQRDQAESTPEAQDAAQTADEAQANTGAMPDSELPEEPEVNADTRADGEIPAATGPGPQENPTP